MACRSSHTGHIPAVGSPVEVVRRKAGSKSLTSHHAEAEAVLERSFLRRDLGEPSPRAWASGERPQQAGAQSWGLDAPRMGLVDWTSNLCDRLDHYGTVRRQTTGLSAVPWTWLPGCRHCPKPVKGT